MFIDGSSLKINSAIKLANTGSHNVDEDINVAVTYCVIQLYIVCPRIEQNSARAKNNINSLIGYGYKGVFVKIHNVNRTIVDTEYTINT